MSIRQIAREANPSACINLMLGELLVQCSGDCCVWVLNSIAVLYLEGVTDLHYCFDKSIRDAPPPQMQPCSVILGVRSNCFTMYYYINTVAISRYSVSIPLVLIKWLFSSCSMLALITGAPSNHVSNTTPANPVCCVTKKKKYSMIQQSLPITHFIII